MFRFFVFYRKEIYNVITHVRMFYLGYSFR